MDVRQLEPHRLRSLDPAPPRGDRAPRCRGTTCVAALTVVCVLGGCGARDPMVDQVVDRLEQQLSESVVPFLAAEGLTDEVWATFDQALRDARRDGVHVAATASSGSAVFGGPAVIGSVLTILGPSRGVCVAVSVRGDGTVLSMPVLGDPAQNCAGAEPLDSSP